VQIIAQLIQAKGGEQILVVESVTHFYLFYTMQSKCLLFSSSRKTLCSQNYFICNWEGAWVWGLCACS